jgi:hypothetical protein
VKSIGRIRMRRIPDGSADSLQAFVQAAVKAGSLLYADGFLSYDRLKKRDYRHRITYLKGRKESASELLPPVHRVVSLLKRRLRGTHQGTLPRPSRLLPRRIHVAVQPPGLPAPGVSYLQTRAAGGRGRLGARMPRFSSTSGPEGRSGAIGGTTTIRGQLRPT